MSQSRKQVEELAKRRGVALAPVVAPARVPAAASTSGAGVGKPGFLAAHMPQAAAMMRELRDQLGPQLYRGILDNLKQGKGYVVDHGTRLAVGSPPVAMYELGKSDVREGLRVTRVRRKSGGVDGS